MNNKALLIAMIIGLGIGLVVGISAASLYIYSREPKAPVQQNHASMMQSEMDAMMMHLHGKTGDALDKAFLEEMIIHHAGAIHMSQETLAQFKHPELVQFARNIISAQTKEIEQMENWLRDWYK